MVFLDIFSINVSAEFQKIVEKSLLQFSTVFVLSDQQLKRFSLQIENTEKQKILNDWI